MQFRNKKYMIKLNTITHNCALYRYKKSNDSKIEINKKKNEQILMKLLTKYTL